MAVVAVAQVQPDLSLAGNLAYAPCEPGHDFVEGARRRCTPCTFQDPELHGYIPLHRDLVMRH